jgi:hypothetical protein
LGLCSSSIFGSKSITVYPAFFHAILFPWNMAHLIILYFKIDCAYQALQSARYANCARMERTISPASGHRWNSFPGHPSFRASTNSLHWLGQNPFATCIGSRGDHLYSPLCLAARHPAGSHTNIPFRRPLGFASLIMNSPTASQLLTTPLRKISNSSNWTVCYVSPKPLSFLLLKALSPE